MADLSITAANVLKGSNAVVEHGIAGETIVAGKVVYREAATGKYKLADNNGASAAVREPRGIALNGGGDGQPLAIARSGDVALGAVLTAGVAYYLSDTAGGIVPVADIDTAGMYFVLLGLAKSTTVLGLDIQASGAAVPA